jgi:hypothetical protein
MITKHNVGRSVISLMGILNMIGGVLLMAFSLYVVLFIKVHTLRPLSVMWSVAILICIIWCGGYHLAFNIGRRMKK